MDLKVDTDRMVEFLVGLLNTPSPTGYHEEAIAYVSRAFQPQQPGSHSAPARPLPGRRGATAMRDPTGEVGEEGPRSDSAADCVSCTRSRKPTILFETWRAYVLGTKQ